MTYYQVLGLNSNASEACIRRAFRCRAKQLHPDINSGLQAKQEFQLVNEAYQVLKNAEQRRIYDLRLMNHRIPANPYFRKHAAYTVWSNSCPSNHPRSRPKYTQSRFEKIFDQFLLLSMLFFGFSAFFFGVLRAVEKPVESVNPYLGIVFGVLFTGLILFGWDKMQRIKG